MAKKNSPVHQEFTQEGVIVNVPGSGQVRAGTEA